MCVFHGLPPALRNGVFHALFHSCNMPYAGQQSKDVSLGRDLHLCAGPGQVPHGQAIPSRQSRHVTSKCGIQIAPKALQFFCVTGLRSPISLPRASSYQNNILHLFISNCRSLNLSVLICAFLIASKANSSGCKPSASCQQTCSESVLLCRPLVRSWARVRSGRQGHGRANKNSKRDKTRQTATNCIVQSRADALIPSFL